MENINLKNVEILKKDGTGNQFLADNGTYKDAGVKDYTKLDNLPTINNTQITGNITLDTNTMNIDSNKNISAKIWKGTKAQYNAITTKDDTMTYVVTDEYDEASKVSGSTTNGNIVIDGVETKVYDDTSIQTSLSGKVNNSQVLTNVPANAVFTDTATTINGKTGAIAKADIVALGIPAQDTNTTYSNATTSVSGLLSNTDKAKLDGIATNASSVTSSMTNGNIKVNGVETKVYDNGISIINRYNTLYNKSFLCSSYTINKQNMNNLIYISADNTPFYLILSDEVQSIDEGHIYRIYCDNIICDYNNGALTNLVKIADKNGNDINGLINYNKQTLNGLYIFVKTNGSYDYMKLIGTPDYTKLLNTPSLYSPIGNPTCLLLGNNTSMNYNSVNGTYSCSSAFGTDLKINNNYQFVCGLYNNYNYVNKETTLFEIGNGTSNIARSNCFEVTQSGKVGIFNDIIIKAGTLLKTVNKTIQGAINELFDFSMPIYKGTLTFSFSAGDKVYGTYVTHNLGYQPSRIEAYLHWEDINGGTGIYKYQFPFQFFSHTDDPPLMYMLGQCGVSDTKINFWVQRFSSFASQPANITIDYYLYK